MRTKIRLYATLRQLVGASEVEVETQPGGTVGEALAKLVTVHPPLRDRLFDGSGELQKFTNAFLNGRSIKLLRGLQTTLQEGDEIALFPPVAGGYI